MEARAVAARLSKRAKVTMLFGVLLGSVACGAEPPVTEEEVLDTSEALAPGDWQTPWLQVGIDLTGTPVACETRFPETGGGVSLFRRGNSSRISFSSMFRSQFSAWTYLDSNTFVSKPACASLDSSHEGSAPKNGQFAVFAKNSQNRYWVSVWRLGTPSIYQEPPTPPTRVHAWEEVSTDTFASAPSATAYFSKLLVLGRTSSNALILRSRFMDTNASNDPYGGGSWDPPLEVPPLPSGWTAAGDPVVLYGDIAAIVTRATSGGSSRLYWCFSNLNMFTDWVRFDPAGVTVASDPSIELGRDRTRRTAYFRASNNRIYQGTSPRGSTTFGTFSAIGTDTFTGAPAAVGGQLGGDPAHQVFAKKSGSDALWNAFTNLTVQ